MATIEYKQYYLNGLGITTYDAGGGGTAYNNIITSEVSLDSTTIKYTVSKLGTVFSISNNGYAAYIESEADDPIKEVRDIKFTGASRICAYARGGYPLQIMALMGFYNNGATALFYPGYYATESAESPNVSGVTHTPKAMTERTYFTVVYRQATDESAHSAWVLASPEPTFSNPDYLFALGMDLHETESGAPWIMSYVTPIWVGSSATIVPLPSSRIEVDEVGATGVIIGATLSAYGETYDISDEATYMPTNSGIRIDENRQIILSGDFYEFGFITVTWEAMPELSATIGVFLTSSGGGDPDNPDPDNPNPDYPDPDNPQAEEPTITAFGEDATYKVGDTAKPLVCEAYVSDGGALSYEWYCNNVLVSETDTCTPTTEAEATDFYYCIVTNTLGGSTATMMSDYVTIEVVEDGSGEGDEDEGKALDKNSLWNGWKLGRKLQMMKK